jgi:hypothetical protein
MMVSGGISEHFIPGWYVFDIITDTGLTLVGSRYLLLYLFHDETSLV